MIALVIGGSGSGKSEFAENLAMKSAENELIYIATMIPYGEEGAKRVARHRELRADKGFKTIEKYLDISEINLQVSQTVLLECMSNLLANEMFEVNGSGKNSVINIEKGIDHLINSAKNVIFVSNNIFDDGIDYDESMTEYIKNLGLINRYISSKADSVYEIVCGIPVILKEKAKC